MQSIFFESVVRRHRNQRGSKKSKEDALFLRIKNQRIYLAVTDARELLHPKARQNSPSPLHAKTDVKPLFSWIEDHPLPLTLNDWCECLRGYRPKTKILVYQKVKYARHKIQVAQTNLELWAREEGVELHPVSDYYPLDRQCSACGALNPYSSKQYPGFHCACGFSTTATLNYFSMLWGARRFELQLKRESEDRPRYRAVS